MFDLPKTKQEFYEKQSKEQLIIFLKNQDYIEETLRDRLFLLSGCGEFGNPDGTNGACIECFYDNRELFRRCEYFSDAYRSYRKDKLEGEEK